MRDKRKNRPRNLPHFLTTAVNDATWLKLRGLLDQNPGNDMSNLIRTILTDRPVRIFTRDETYDNLLDELARIRTEIRRIGVNINQVTRQVNSFPEPQRKALYARVAFDQFLVIEPKIDRLLEITAQLAKKWLSA
jgi:hypothetical protein